MKRILVATLCALYLHPAEAASSSFRTVALTENPAPGTTAVFSDLFGPTINNSGQVAFRARISEPGTTVRNGIWSEGGGSLSLVAVSDSIAPGTAGFFGATSRPVLNEAGQTSFRSNLFGPNVNSRNNHAIWIEREQSLAVVALDGESAPGTDANFRLPASASSTVDLNNAGQIAFLAEFSGPQPGVGLWSGGSGSLALVARTGDIAPGILAEFSGFSSPALNNSGQVAFLGFINGSGVDSSNNTGIWREGGGNLALVAREGNIAPGTNANFSSFNTVDPGFNNAGQTAFGADLAGPGVTNENDGGIWIEENGSLELVAREGNNAPGTSAVFSFLDDPIINGTGSTAFIATLSGPGVTNDNDAGIWSGESGRLVLIARDGDNAPGTNAFFSGFSRFNLNSAGRTAFLGAVTGPGVTSENNDGIWAEDETGNLQLVVREGELFDVDDGAGTDLRVVSSIGLLATTGNEDGGPVFFNDLGQLVFDISFTDGSSGVFVSKLVAESIPGDFNSDGVVNPADFTVWRDYAGAADVGEFGPGDANGDSQVTIADYQFFVDQFGATLGDSTPANAAAAAAASAATPEPASLVLLLPALALPWRVR